MVHLECEFFSKVGIYDYYFLTPPFLSLAVALRDIYEKIYKSVEAKSTPPNAWLWSLIESCANKKDIDLLFQTLQNLRRFVSHLVYSNSFVFYISLLYFIIFLFYRFSRYMLNAEIVCSSY